MIYGEIRWCGAGLGQSNRHTDVSAAHRVSEPSRRIRRFWPELFSLVVAVHILRRGRAEMALVRMCAVRALVKPLTLVDHNVEYRRTRLQHNQSRVLFS